MLRELQIIVAEKLFPDSIESVVQHHRVRVIMNCDSEGQRHVHCCHLSKVKVKEDVVVSSARATPRDPIPRTDISALSFLAPHPNVSECSLPATMGR